MLIKQSTYKAPLLSFSMHWETIAPSLLRKVKGVDYQRERISTTDDDFLDLDWLNNGNKKLVIISHGLEGSSDRPYMLGMAKIFSTNAYDVLAWNYRGCSGEMNKKVRFYHSGATDDLACVIQHAISKGYEQINLVGFSLGGNLTLKYLGEQHGQDIHRTVVFSVPIHLHDSCVQINKWFNFPYNRRFINHLKKKVRAKNAIMPEQLPLNGLGEVRSVLDFDNQYTAPIHGYKDAIDYYTKCSAINFLTKINTPTLIVNAKNDSFLTGRCYPYDILADHPTVDLETPDRGGHCGFPGADENGHYWSERRALEFISRQ